jgi:integrase
VLDYKLNYDCSGEKYLSYNNLFFYGCTKKKTEGEIMSKNEVDWNEPPLQRWLGSTGKKNTLKTYRVAFRAYAQFTGLTATQMIDEAIEDQKRDVRERKDVAKARIRAFYDWLQKEYNVEIRGKERNVKGVRAKTASTFVGAIRSFYAKYDLAYKFMGRERLPKPRVHNKRMQLTTMDIKALVDNARTPRDRAIILTMFQGGMDVSTLCSMTYGDVADGIAKNEQPLKVELQRPKTGVEYYTFLGRDSVGAIKAYLNDAKHRGIQFKSNTPLFVQNIKSENEEPLALETGIVQKVMRGTAARSGLVDDENNGKDMNPVSPHALRESFGSIMISNGVPDTIVDFWLGHEIGEMAEAYKGGRFNELRALYAEKEKLISITTSEIAAVDDIKREFSNSIASLALENKSLRDRVVKLEEDLRWAIDEIKTLEEETPEE